MNTLHREIHSKAHDIPVPNKAECKLAYNELNLRIAKGELDLYHDHAEKRLEFLIQLWEGQCPATVAMLKWQRDIIAKFYAKRRR